MYYNSSNSSIYVASSYLNSIDTFDLNLNLVHTFSTATLCSPVTISGFDKRLYVGCFDDRMILVIENEQIVSTFKVCNGHGVRSIIFDQSGFMATTCYSYGIFLYDQNLNYTGKLMIIPKSSSSVAFDSKGRFVFILIDQILLYY
jgi:hypothetical protein